MPARKRFPWVHHERVRFNDCDPMGHANNALYSTYLEEARIGVLGGLEEFILAHVDIDFRDQLRPGDRVEIRTRCSRIGTKSFDLEHELWAGDRLAAEAVSTLVSFDYSRGASIRVPERLRRRLAGSS